MANIGRLRLLGARLLPQVPEPLPRAHRSLVERRERGGGRAPLRGWPPLMILQYFSGRRCCPTSAPRSSSTA
jgi:hypothetical protein